MGKIAENAEVYASTRIGIFFPASSSPWPGTGADGDLTGQCVTLNKWFLAEMTDVPEPFRARGDARYVGDNLVAQGHAIEVPYEQRRRGDFAVFKYGQYGHIGLMIDSDRIFEENANVGVARRVLRDGTVVYASRVGRLSESWRVNSMPRPNIYRIKTYSEQGANMAVDSLSKEDIIEIHRAYFVGDPGPQFNWGGYLGKPLALIVNDFKNSSYRQNVLNRYYAFDTNAATITDLTGRVADLTAKLGALQADDEADQAAIDSATKALSEAQKQLEEAQAKNTQLALERDQLQQDKDSATKAGDSFLRILGDFVKKYFTKEK